MIAVDVNDVAGVFAAGRKVLNDNLGPEAARVFIDVTRGGKGDYTKEKYDRPDMTAEELAAFIAEAEAEPGAILD
jgi:hypothetical protein